MSTIPVPRSTSVSSSIETPAKSADPFDLVMTFVRPLGSLKVAVVSFALAILLVFIGTLAQVERDIWEVLEIYFKSWATFIEARILFPRSWFPHLEEPTAVRWFAVGVMGFGSALTLLAWSNARYVSWARPVAIATFMGSLTLAVSALVSNGFWFPGGATIGVVMAVNLLAAHLVRYKVQAKGGRLWAGLALTVLGVLVTWLVILSGHNSDGLQGAPPFAWSTLWTWTKLGLSFTALGLFVSSAWTDRNRWGRILRAGTGILLGILAIWLWAVGDRAYLGDSGMRILWQLALASIAAIILLVGCVILFERRAGVVVLHAGIGLMMFGQWFVSTNDVEEQINLAEGETTNFAQDIRSVELAVIRPKSSKFDGRDDVIAIPLTENGYRTPYGVSEPISHDELPFDIEVVQFEKNSSVRMATMPTSKPSGSDSSAAPKEDAAESKGKAAEKTPDSAPALTGVNKDFQLVPMRQASGTDGGEVDLAGGYFRLIDKKTSKPIGTYLLSQTVLTMRGGQSRAFDLQKLEHDANNIELQLRFQRNYKDYQMTLLDVSKKDYLGTSIPRDYSSEVRLVDSKRNTDQQLKIWMNNPQRYAGETFYQSSYRTDQLGKEYTTLQVVKNQGWMIPYVACMICGFGMAYHFLFVLMRFLDRQTRRGEVTPSSQRLATSDAERPVTGWRKWAVPGVVAIVFVGLMAALMRMPRYEANEMDLAAFGQLPVVYKGRVQPFDSLARNSLLAVAETDSFRSVKPVEKLKAEWPEIQQKLLERFPKLKAEDVAAYQNGDVFGLMKTVREKTNEDQYAVWNVVTDLTFERQPAIRWLLDTITGSEQTRRHPVIRIDHPQVQALLGLEKRKRYRYALEEIMPKLDAFQEQVRQAGRVAMEDEGQLDLYQRKVLELDRRIRTIMTLHSAFSPPEFPPLPTIEEIQNQPDEARKKLQTFQAAMMEQREAFRASEPPLAIAPTKGKKSIFGATEDTESEDWQAYAAAWPIQVLQTRFLNQPIDPHFQSMNEILLAYLDRDATKFNSKVSQYQNQLKIDAPKALQAKTSLINTWVTQRFGSFYQFESFYNHAAPFWWASTLYMVAFIMLAVSWLRWRRPLSSAAFWLVVFTLGLHTAAIVARIYLSGRPPVTNLYSSAIFIGWGTVALSLVIEWFFKNGSPTIVASLSGFVALMIANNLAADGDTMQVLQAVLDTQFWLATHVLCITLGYATTYLAGVFGLLYVVRGVLTTSLTKEAASDLTRMTYGSLCFAILFSFIGTVLGGLWADDSWGRFWGWDPKENGALIIVLWNALVLHARWDGMIRERGLAVLALFGNIVTSWSWFGVNELGVGLHSYGFTEGVLVKLGLAVLFHILMIGLGCMPLDVWMSYFAKRMQPEATTSTA